MALFKDPTGPTGKSAFGQAGGNSFVKPPKSTFKAPSPKETRAEVLDAQRIQNRFAALDEEDLSAEEHSTETYTIAQQEFKARAEKENARMMNAVDSEYWFAVVFQNREQKEQFLKAAGLMDIGDKYLPGAAVAERMGVQVDAVAVSYNTSDKLDPKWEKLARPLPKGGGL